MDADLGRFISRDLIGYAGGSLGLYEYVGGRPTQYVDPFGLGPSGTAAAPFTIDVDPFNIFNESYILQRQRGPQDGNFLRETLSLRVWRMGPRLNWKQA